MNMTDVYMIMASYTAVLFMSFFIIGWLQSGFFIPFLKVKTSRGKGVLIRIRKTTGSDYVAAKIDEGTLIFKYFKQKKRLSKFQNGLYRSFNINCVDIDGETWGVINNDFTLVSSNDPAKTDSLIERALYSADKVSNKEIIIIVLLIIIAFGLIYVGYKINFLETMINQVNTIGGSNL